MQDMTAAQALLAKAKEFADDKTWGSRIPLTKAIAILEQIAPDSEELADAYLAMCFVHFDVKRRAHQASHRSQALAWYEKAIAVWERNGNLESLAGNLTNLGSLYYRYGDFETSLARNLRGLELERQSETLGAESVAAWNHVGGCYLALGRLDEAEATVREGLQLLGDSTPNSAYLWSTLASIYQARAAAFHKRAEELAPPDSCPI